MYYNEPQKIEYLESEDNRFEQSTLEVAKNAFRGSAVVEEQAETDLSNFTRNQVIKLLKKYNANSIGYYKMLCIIFSDYYNWCIRKGYVDESNFTDWYASKSSNLIIDEVLPVRLIKEKFFLIDEAKMYVEKVKDPVNKLFLYAAFLGINGENHNDLRYLSVNDLFESRKAIQLNSGKIQFIDDLFIKLLKDADKARIYYPEGEENFTSNRNEYGDSIYVFKQCIKDSVNLPVTNQIFTNRMSTIKKQTGNKFVSISNLYRNGLISAIKEHYEKQGISLYTALFHEINKKLYTYDDETQDVITRYNSKMTVRMLRMELKDIIEYYM